MKEKRKKQQQQQQQQTKTKSKKSKGNRSYSGKVKTTWFCCAFKLGFLQSICQASLIFNSNLELALSTILKEKYYMMFKNMRLVIPFDMLLNLSFKITISLVNIARTTARASKFIY